jgi:HPt (histidine-containing phosphotransfer) domain-containing protein
MSVEEASINFDPAQSQVQSLLADTGGDAIEATDETVLAALEEVQSEGEPDLIVELIDLYLNDAPQRVEAIRAAAAKLDGALLKHAAHTLKGSSGSIGVLQVAKICKILERPDCVSSAAKVEVLLQLLEREFAGAREALLAERQRRVS